MKIKIDSEKCIGCGTCSVVASGTFRMGDDFKAEVLEEVKDDEATIKSAVESCPAQAISIE